MCSKTYNDYIFQDLVMPSNMSFKAEVLKSDELELRLYQVCPTDPEQALRWIGPDPGAQRRPNRSSTR